MGKLRDWTLFPAPITVQAEDEESAIAKAKTYIQQNLNQLEFEDIVDEGEADAVQVIDEAEIIKLAEQSPHAKEDTNLETN
jgi:hypothetical protein